MMSAKASRAGQPLLGVFSAPVMAFFDVDETLISCKSMFSFLYFYLQAGGEPASTYYRLVKPLRVMAPIRSRSDVNRAYYRLYRGEAVTRLARTGRDWLRTQLEDPQFLLPAAAEHAAHRARGTETHLVSGSFFACLDPLAELVDATASHGTPVMIHRGHLTGEVNIPMIGEEKAHKLTAVRTAARVPRAGVIAYGDDPSDLFMLEAAGFAVVVGDNPRLMAAASQHGWRRLPGLSECSRLTAPRT
ncbi:MAG: HAD-superfamily subfamily hydrolase [Frankiales bacterium]|nr:HAD-superfamily subfamily hydrolase [Frankiales bacterium]